MHSDTLRVSQYLDEINRGLKDKRGRILGEICSIQEYPGRSYLYYSIRDTTDGSTVKCFMWKNDYRISGVTLAEGMEVVLTAYPAIYKPNGGLSLQVEAVELVGEGALKAAYDALKKKLEDEGLFKESRKREIPLFPHRIGVITSKSGAVINDFLSNIGKWGFDIQFVDSKVEGQDAVRELLSAISTLRKKDIDVLVIMRGGGSLESFLAFNNETLVRALAEFPAPVITGIGHDKDVPLASFVSDRNVSTPTAVANLLNESWSAAAADIRHFETRIEALFEATLKDAYYAVEHAALSIEKRFVALFEAFRRAEAALLSAAGRMETRIARLTAEIEEYAKEYVTGFERVSYRAGQFLAQAGKTIELASPMRQLSRGYSIVKKNGKVVRSQVDTEKGDELIIMVSDGIINSQVL